MVKADNEAWRIFDRKDWLVFMGDQYKVKTPPDGSLRGADRERAPSSVLSGRSLAAQTAIITAIIVIIAGCVSKSESGHDSLSPLVDKQTLALFGAKVNAVFEASGHFGKMQQERTGGRNFFCELFSASV